LDLGALQNLITDVERLFDSHQYGEAGRQIYDFFWSEYADWYLEIAKIQLNRGEIELLIPAVYWYGFGYLSEIAAPVYAIRNRSIMGTFENCAIDQSEAFAPHPAGRKR
jgi:valyl-tRNA synthetase